MRAEYGYYEYLEKEWEAHGSWEVMPERDRSSSLLRATPPFPCLHCRFTQQKRTLHNLQQLYIAHTMSQQSTSCWIRRCNRQYIFLPQFTLVSRCRARDEKFLSLKTHSQASSAIATNSVSSLPQQRLDPSRGGQMIAPILSRKRDNRERSFFPQKKGSQWTHSIPSRTERACSSPKHITHRSCVSSTLTTLTRIDTPPKALLNRHISTHTSETRSPEGKERMMCSTGAPKGVPKATLERGRSVEFPSEGNWPFHQSNQALVYCRPCKSW